jgi:hypothetical protein
VVIEDEEFRKIYDKIFYWLCSPAPMPKPRPELLVDL